jgi:1-acyl-sn-glycerol-3-phosphate acyltransferase
LRSSADIEMQAAPSASQVGKVRIALRFARVVLHLLRGLAISAFLFPLTGAAYREQCVRTWSAQLLAILRVQLQPMPEDAQLPARAALIVANHISWLDIFVINALRPCRFVAKADIRHWPVLGWLCAKAGTIFIARGRQREVRRVYQGLVTALQAGERIAFFPEGTTAAQGTLLPFHANLFEAAIEAQVPVQPCALRYLDGEGELHRAADFIGDTSFVDSLLLILRSSPMRAEIVPLPLIASEGAHRRDLSVQARAAIAAALMLPADANSTTVPAAADS